MIHQVPDPVKLGKNRRDPIKRAGLEGNPDRPKLGPGPSRRISLLPKLVTSNGFSCHTSVYRHFSGPAL